MAPYKSKGRGTRTPGIRALADGRWLVTKTWIDEKTGRRIYRSKTVEGTKDDAAAARAGLRSAATSDAERSRPRLKAFAEDWLKRREPKLQPSTLARYTVDVANLVVEFGDWWVDALTYEDIERWQNEMSALLDKKGKRVYANATINGWHRTLRLVLDVAERKHILSSNPARALPVLTEGRTKGPRGTALSANQLGAFEAGITKAVEEKKLGAEMGRMLVVLAWNGARLGEVVALRWTDDVDGELRIERSVWRGHEKEGKTDDPRRVTITEPVRQALDEQRRWLLETQHPGLSSGLVFPSSPQQALAGASRRGGAVTWYRSQSAIQAAVRTVCKVAGVPQISPHSLRRTFEDLLRQAGVDQLVRRAMAGWRSEGAEGIYATVRRDERDAAAAAMLRLVRG